MNPLVSAIIPTYNRAHVLAEAVQSVLNQTYRNLELVIVDDGSTDGTEDLVKQIDDDRIRYVRQENAGVSAARNHGIRIAVGELIAFLDSDDLWEPEKIERQVALFSNPETGWVYTNVRFFGTPDAEKRDHFFAGVTPARGMILKDLFMRNPVYTQTLMVRRRCLDQVGGYNESYSFSEDVDLHYRLASRFEVDYLDAALCAVRLPSGTSYPSMVDRKERWIEIRREVLKANPHFKASLTHDELMRPFYKMLIGTAVEHLRVGNRSRARELLRECIDFEPSWTKARIVMLLSYSPVKLPWPE